MSTKTYQDIKDYIDLQNQDVKVLHTGFDEIDIKLKNGGMREDFLCFIYAKASVGKSYFMVNWVYRLINLYDSIKVAIFSLEMPSEAIYDRFTQLMFAVNPNDIRVFVKLNGHSFTDKLNEIKFMDKVDVICDGKSIDDIERYVRECSPDIIFIDHLHLIRSRRYDIYEKTNDIVEGLVRIKKNYPKTRIICLAQQKRTDRETAGTSLPYLEDAKGSGIIEESADLIIGLCRPDISQTCPPEFKEQVHGGLLKRRYPSHERNDLLAWNYDRFTSKLTYVKEF